jgi:nucleoside-diphosphate-sugar epimerase
MRSAVRVLITGATGFIGRATVARLGELDADISVASRRPEGGAVPPRSHLIEGDGTDAAAWRSAVAGVTAVIHLAGRAHVLKDRATDPLEEFRRVNVRMSTALGRAAIDAGVRRFVFVSSIGVLGERTEAGRPFSERSLPAPVAPYAVPKLEAEEALQALTSGTGTELVIVRPPLVHGPGAPGNFARLLRLVSRGWPLPLGGLTNLRSFIGVRNLAAVLATAALREDALAAPIVPSDLGAVGTTELVRWMADDLGVPLRLVTVPGLSAWRRLPVVGPPLGKLADSLEVDSGPSWQRLGLLPEVSLRDGLREMSLHHRNSSRSR